MFRALKEAFEGLRWFGREAQQKGYGGGASAASAIRTWETAADTFAGADGFLTQPVAQHPTVNRAIRTIASSIAQVTLEVYPPAPEAPAPVAEPDHWLPALFQRPSAGSYGDSFQELVVMFLESRGEAFLWHQDIRRDAGGGFAYPHEIWFLWPESMQPLPATAQRIEQVEGWRYMGPEGIKQIPNAELTFLRYPNPHDAIRGMNPLRAVMVEYSADHRMAIYNRAFYENSAMPSIIFTSKSQWPEEERKAFVKGWELKLRGASRQAQAAALPKDVEATIVKLTQQEMAFLDSRRFSREQILSVYGVPPAVAGVFEYANYANAEQQERFFITKSILPKLRYLESAYTMGLLAQYQPGYRAVFKVQSMLAELMAEQFAKKVETGDKLWHMGFPASDINERLELGMDTEGKDWLDEGFLPFNVVPAEALITTGDIRVGDEASSTGQTPPGKSLRAAGEPVAFLPQPGPGLLLPEKSTANRDSRWSGLATQWGSIGRAYHRRLRSWLWGLRGEVLGKLAARDTGKGVRRDSSHQDASGLLFNEGDAKVKLIGISKPAWSAAIQAGVSALLEETGIVLDFNFLDPRVLAFLADKAVKIAGVSEGVKERITATLAEGISNGEAIADLAARVRGAFDVERSHSLTIARTETAQAFGGGRYQGMLQAGIVFQDWLSSRDDRVRDSHAEIDGEVVAVGERFSNGLLFPGDPSGSPEEVINCRCVTIPASIRGTGEED